MDKRAIVAISGGIVVVVGVALGTGDDVKNEDGTAPTVVGVSIQGSDLVQADGTVVPLVQDATSAEVVDGSARVPTKAGATIVETTDVDPQYVANALAACTRYAAETGETAPRQSYWETLRDKLVAAGVVMPEAQP